MYTYKRLMIAMVGLILVVAAVFTIGCSSMQPYTVEQEADGMKPGSGILTGETGEKTIFRVPADSEAPQEKTKAAEAS